MVRPLTLEDYLPVQTHKPYSNYRCSTHGFVGQMQILIHDGEIKMHIERILYLQLHNLKLVLTDDTR